MPSRWNYTLRLPVDGKEYEVQFDDWMFWSMTGDAQPRHHEQVWRHAGRGAAVFHRD